MVNIKGMVKMDGENLVQEINGEEIGTEPTDESYGVYITVRVRRGQS